MKLLILNRKALFLILILLILAIIIPIMVLNYGRSKDVFMQDIFYEGTNDEKIISFACNIDWGKNIFQEC